MIAHIKRTFRRFRARRITEMHFGFGPLGVRCNIIRKRLGT